MFKTVHTAANGDQLFEEALVEVGVGWVSVFTGGTGRFENASGHLEAVYTYRLPPTGDPPIAIFGFEGSGTITY